MFYVFNNFALDTDRRELRAGCEAVDVEPQVFDLLGAPDPSPRARCQPRRADRVDLGRARRLKSALSTRINAVRTAIGDSGIQQHLIKTLPRRGIRFVGEVREEQKAPEASAAPQNGTVETMEVRQPDEVLPADLTTLGHSDALPPARTASGGSHRFFVPRAATAVFVVIGLVGFSQLTSSYFARWAQSDQVKAHIEMAAKLTHISQNISMTSREDYEAVRNLQQWAFRSTLGTRPLWRA